MINVFAYGTLMFPEVAMPIAQISGGGEPITIQGYRRYEATTRENGNYPAIVKEDAHSVDGLLFQNLSERQLAQLDWFEDINEQDTGLYIRNKTTVPHNGKTLDVWLYVCGPELQSLLKKPLQKSWNPVTFQRDELDWYITNIVNKAIGSNSYLKNFG